MSTEFLRFFDVSADDAGGLECAAVHYAASIRLPEAFVSFLRFWRLSVDIPLTVDKQVCHSDRLVLESAVIREPVLDEIRMTTRHELVSAWDVDSASHMQMRLPWYARLLEPQIAEALDRSVGEKLDTVMASLCDAPTFPAFPALLRPDASFAAPADAAPAPRKFLLRRTEPDLKAQPRWHEYR